MSEMGPNSEILARSTCFPLYPWKKIQRPKPCEILKFKTHSMTSRRAYSRTRRDSIVTLLTGCRSGTMSIAAESVQSLFRFDGIETELWILDLTRFLNANRRHPGSRPGQASLENALPSSGPEKPRPRTAFGAFLTSKLRSSA